MRCTKAGGERVDPEREKSLEYSRVGRLQGVADQDPEAQGPRISESPLSQPSLFAPPCHTSQQVCRDRCQASCKGNCGGRIIVCKSNGRTKNAEGRRCEM